jgi:hypothetical protein
MTRRWLVVFGMMMWVCGGMALTPNARAGTDAASPPPEPGWRIVRGADYQGAIVPVEAITAFVGLFDEATVQGAWIPDRAQLDALEAGLPDALGTLQLPRPLRDYGRQYAGFVAGGHAYILVNAFCDAPADWTHAPVWVADGGACFFQITYEPATGAFTNLRVNGEA